MAQLKIWVFSMTLMVGWADAQHITCAPQDLEAFSQKTEELAKIPAADIGTTMVAVGKTFRGTPYVAKTLEIGTEETLVVNLTGLDCTTFVENVLAFSRLLRDNSLDYDSFTRALETIRYREGQLNGYGSRLHYFSDWIRDNEQEGLVKEITGTIGGVALEKNIDFMGTHRDLYPFLADESNYRQILETEAKLKEEPLCYLPSDQIEANEHLIQSGDIIALATSIKGLDVTHTGIASREADGRIHLLHASTGSMQVEVTEKPLADYLQGIKGNIGILVARPE